MTDKRLHTSGETITASPLWPFLKERGISEAQAEALEIELYLDHGGSMSLDAMVLLPVQTILDALPAIDYHPWKDTSAVEFREMLQDDLKATGIQYWIVGQKSLAIGENQ